MVGTIEDHEEEAKAWARETDREHMQLGNCEVLGPAPAGNELERAIEGEAYQNLDTNEKLLAWELYWDCDDVENDLYYMDLEGAARHIGKRNQLKLGE